MRRKREISRSAWDVYEQLCAYGDAESGAVEDSYVSNARLVADTGLKLGTVKNAMTELRKKEWLSEHGTLLKLRVGTFLAARRRQRKTSLHSDAPSLRNDAPSLVSDDPSLTSDDHIDKDRARVLTNPLTNPSTNPHTNPRALAPEPPAAGVGVARSKFSERVCVAWATWRKAQLDSGIRDAYAVGRARWQDGTADELIAEWQARTPERIAEEQARPVQQALFFPEALRLVKSTVAGHGVDAASVIASLSVSDDVRAKLREHFDGAEARAHSPPVAAAG
jgi:hypothetical protein